MSGFSRPAGGEDVDHAFRRNGARDDLADGLIQLLVWSRRSGRALDQHRLHRLEERDVVADANRVLMRHRERKGTGEVAHRLNAAVLAVLLREDVFLRRRQQAQPLLRRTRDPRGAVEAVEQPAADVELLQHDCDRLALIECRPSGAAALGVGRERPLQLVGEPEIVDDEAARLVPEHAVDARNRLHQPVAAHRLVDVHRVQARRVEAGEPHVAHQHHLKRVPGVAEPARERLPAGLVPDVRLPVGRVGGRAGHDDLDAPLSSSSSCQSGRRRTSSR